MALSPGGPRHRPGRPNVPVSGQLLVGLVVLTVGVLLTLDNLGFLRAGDFLRFWPVVLLVVGAMHIRQARTPARVVSGLIWMLVGSILLGNRLNLWYWDIWDFWPLLLVVFGVFILSQAFRRHDGKPPADGGLNAAKDDGSVVSGIAVLGGFQRKVSSQEFRGGDLTAFMGGCMLDLRGAELAGGRAEINAFVLMGGIALRVPEGWDVRVEAVPFMGGIEDKTRQTPGESMPRLVVKGFIMMGGVEIKN